jgi:AcrR family transcriptional regulator
MVSAAATSSPAPERRANRSSEAVRSRLVQAALVEFAAHGFDGASTRAIAARADAHQPQINYHFESKDALWRAGLEQLLTELDVEIAARTAGVAPDDPRARFEAVIRGMVHFAAAHPALSRIMMHEATAPSPRLAWLVETHLEGRYRALLDLWATLTERGDAAPVPPDLLYHVLIGAASLVHANAPEMRLLTGQDPSSPRIVQAHADALVALFLTPEA